MPRELRDVVPACARQCLEGYIEQGWTCSGNNGGCLCSQYSSQGFTLGELAYICLQQDCSQRSHEEAVQAYQICSAHGRAVTATHDTLTVPAQTTTARSPSSRPGAEPTSKSSASVHTSRTLATQTSSAKASSSEYDSATHTVMASTASTTSSASAGAANSAKDPTSLTTAQAIGISVACMGAVIIAICVFYLVICLRRRKVKVRDEKQERDSYDFVDEAPPRFSPFHYGYADPRGPLGGFYGQRAELMSEKRNSKWYREHYLAEPVNRYEKGFENSPKSHHSRSTISQLLPEKPKATPPQLRTQPPQQPLTRPSPHLRPRPSPRPLSNFTAPTVFEEDRSPPMPQSMFPPSAGLPSHPKAFHYPQVTKPQQARYAEQFTQSPVSMRQPSLSIEIPQQPTRVVKSPVQVQQKGSAQLRQRSPVQREQRTSEARSSRSATSFLNYYASPDADAMRSPESPTPIDDNAQTRRAVPTAITVTKPTYPPRAVRVTSGASDTSFESTDPDEPTPPDEDDKQLTPVKEHSPIAGIKYPKVPRSSNQAIPRSPPVGANASPSIGSKVSPSPRQMRKPNALPVGAHATGSPQQKQGSPRRTPTQTYQRQPPPSQQARPTGQIPRKPVPSYQPRQQPVAVTPERQLNTNNSNLSGSTLAAKRRGDTAAHDLEQKFHVQTSQGRDFGTDKPLPPPATRRSPHNSPLKGYGRVTTNSRNNSPIATRPQGFPQGQPLPPQQQQQQQGMPTQAQRRYPVKPAGGGHPTGYRQPGQRTTGGRAETEVEAPMKSPLWEPKLTPSRKGEDLYLSVGSATPRTEGFGWGGK